MNINWIIDGEINKEKVAFQIIDFETPHISSSQFGPFDMLALYLIYAAIFLS